ncbi:AAA family ATPase [Cryobacterium luteum]|uniref:AAA family ATPase n=1 Tax=Cryobacterium luteum TaxID=1424661 RepID=A0A1H8IGY6_9MICO|nr:AAA family ATPase [Cryobacterium luteum]TFB95528.1 AAA family ATPase [Cryobacterium luteum]SEN66918.1 ATPase family associated with various cellular activities (AAA) [Cryobacterium luteum]
MIEDTFDRDVVRSFKKFIERVVATADAQNPSGLSPLGDAISEFLGANASTLPVVSETLADHRLVDADVALTTLGGLDQSNVRGVSGGQQRFHSSLSELVASPFQGFGLGPVDYSARATGPTSTRQVVSFGLRLIRFEGQPIAVLQRAANPQFGRNTAELEIMAESPETVTAFLERLRGLMIEHSVLRGQVLSFVQTEYGAGAGITFLERPVVSAAAIVLPESILSTITDHVIGIGEQRQVLLAAGQHLKRGVLLYGPPGTGKTLTVRHLLSETPGITAVLLTGSSIVHIAAAAEIARTFAPSMVVLEDIDLVAMQRNATPQPLLFEVLDALDGLDGDADVAFVMTTNRVEVLERALAERPGRVDLAVEVPLPALAERERLFRRYAQNLPFSPAALDAAAGRAEGVTGSFAKELIRRAVLRAALREGTVDDTDLQASLDDLLSAGESLTRRLLGTSSGDTPRWQPDEEPSDGPNEGSYVPRHGLVMTREASFGWVTASAAQLSAAPPPAPAHDATREPPHEPPANPAEPVQ